MTSEVTGAITRLNAADSSVCTYFPVAIVALFTAQGGIDSLAYSIPTKTGTCSIVVACIVSAAGFQVWTILSVVVEVKSRTEGLVVGTRSVVISYALPSTCVVAVTQGIVVANRSGWSVTRRP